jgi:hypothetical protein
MASSLPALVIAKDDLNLIMLKPMLSVILILLFLTPPQICKSQSVTGFWEVTEVMVGKEVKTPVAKWTRINKDGSFQSGNGGIQNSEGTWSFNKKTKLFLPIETNLKDPYGGFNVRLSKNQMFWERSEDGEVVKVKLVRINKLPKSTADLLVGLWDLKEITKKGQSEKSSYDPDDKHYIFIRWDRIYVERTPDGNKASGYWHIDAHAPQLTFLSHKKNKPEERWQVEVNNTDLKMVGLSDSNKGTEVLYIRIDEFPK